MCPRLSVRRYLFRAAYKFLIASNITRHVINNVHQWDLTQPLEQMSLNQIPLLRVHDVHERSQSGIQLLQPAELVRLGKRVRVYVVLTFRLFGFRLAIAWIGRQG